MQMFYLFKGKEYVGCVTADRCQIDGTGCRTFIKEITSGYICNVDKIEGCL